MPRFFISPEAFRTPDLELTGEDAHHAVRVLRLGPGDVATLLDGCGRVVDARVLEASPRLVRLAIEREAVQAPAGPRVTLVQALPKGDKLDWIVQKATELGASAIRLVSARRCVLKLEAGRADARLARLAAIAREAAEQCERPDLPAIGPVTPPGDVPWPADALGLVLAERAGGPGLLRALPASPPAGGFHLWVGPEGGWDPGELALLQARGAVCVSLGPRILRTETAGLAALAILHARYEGESSGGGGDR